MLSNKSSKTPGSGISYVLIFHWAIQDSNL